MRPYFRILGAIAMLISGCGDDDNKSSVSETQVPIVCPANDINDVIAAKPKPRPPLPTRVTLTSVTPNRGGEGALVTIEGPDFGSKNRPGAVFFDNVTAPVYSWAPTQVVTAVPTGLVADVYGVRVSVPNRGFSNSVSFAVQPVITSLQPLQARAGDTITLTGTGFGPTADMLLVQCEEVTPTAWSPTAITFTVPQLAETVTASVVVQVNDIPSEAASFRYLSTVQHNVWYPMATTADLFQPFSVAQWTGSEMLFYQGGSAFTKGGRYDPATNTWRAMNVAGAPTYGRIGVWTGGELIVTSVENGATARYSSTTDQWTAAAAGATAHPGVGVWTGQEMLVWGAEYGYTASNAGARYNPLTDTWAAMTTEGAPAPRHLRPNMAVWSGEAMIVWGGENLGQYMNTGGLYDPVIDEWAPTPLTGAPAARAGNSAVWTGSQMIVWGGRSITAPYMNTGGLYDPVSNTWQATPLTGAPSARFGHTAVWTGSLMIVWGGDVASITPSAALDRQGALGAVTNTGGRYSPTTNSWQPTSVTGAPSPRSGHVAVWDGTEMIIWGGTGGATGGRYVP